MNRRDYIKNTATLLGISLTGISLNQILTSCQSQSQLTWKPVFFDNNQAALIADIAEIILPKTQTPGAKDLAVPQFIDKMVKDTMDSEAQKDLLDGLDEFEKNVKDKYSKSFLELSLTEQTDYITLLDKEKPRSGIGMWGIALEKDPPKPTFFKIIKGLTLFGFYTSQEIGQNVLAYDPIPGGYIACMPIGEQNTWNE